MNGKIILEGEQVKLLGVNINNNLNFNSHIKEISGKVNEKASAFSKLRGYVSETKAIILLNTVVMSHFQYCPVIWLFCNKAADNSINRTTKFAKKTL